MVCAGAWKTLLPGPAPVIGGIVVPAFRVRSMPGVPRIQYPSGEEARLSFAGFETPGASATRLVGGKPSWLSSDVDNLFVLYVIVAFVNIPTPGTEAILELYLISPICYHRVVTFLGTVSTKFLLVPMIHPLKIIL